MIPIPQSTARVVMLKLFLTGTTTAATGKTLAIVLGKAGAAFANPNAGATNATEVSNGWYKVTLDTTDTGTLGDLVVRGTASGCDDSERLFGVVKATNAGLTALPDTAVTTNASLLTVGTGTAQINPASGKVPATIAAGDIANNALTAAALATDAVAKITTAVLTTQMTESYAANGTAPTLAQAAFAIHQHLMGFVISGTSYTVLKLNGTTAFVATLNDSSSPTGEVRT